MRPSLYIKGQKEEEKKENRKKKKNLKVFDLSHFQQAFSSDIKEQTNKKLHENIHSMSMQLNICDEWHYLI